MTTPSRIEADYIIETAFDPLAAAEAMAGEQSSGTFVAIPGETPELKARSAARIEALEPLESVEAPSLPGAGRPKLGDATVRRARVTLSWPLDNVGPSLPNLMATVAGNLFELKQFSGLRLIDIRLPQAFGDAYPGPKFSVAGTRRLAGVEGRPLIGTIVKPSVGFGPQETAALVSQLCDAGIDFIKDDELQSDGPHCRFDARVRAVMEVINDHAERTGKKVMFAFNLTGEIDQMRWRHDLVLEQGGTCVMASLNSVGLVGMIELCRFTQLPVHAHRNGWGYLSRAPMLGWSYVAWQKIWRLAGADHMHVNGLANKFSEADDSVIASARECLTPMFPDKPCIAMPVFSSGQSAKQAPGTFAALGSPDLIFAAGGGIMAHPDGPAAGVASLREAWDAAIARVPLADYARDHAALARALEAYAG
ncbi:ribulose-bisphosphate carboxylase large subunit family protein [Ancylobacter dichloromethanicus]|uniref:Ribulose-1,5-bisphosphate carboxylase/oxygenase large subunit n=1 Tax=Ancylobacter dichloromethanicus TaxID=518825 RepID=A0A9W6J9M9_9HYPH|nr:ribulose-bisphosphate carboxylase large subunit family protein [Ancylobacter dichloromethanicus]MBS7553175.1 ribulose-bisphosphate carboxylase large subunit family protein [Ancylobacter dichloromethanicus]GLK72952.1 ribulose-1,5-bisphosphate carboxylase/oxygenase large subunit [Ancylobacter dichloromethanicus]